MKYFYLIVMLFFTYSCQKKNSTSYNPYEEELLKTNQLKAKKSYYSYDGKIVEKREKLPKELRIAKFRVDSSSYDLMRLEIERFFIRKAYQKELGFTDFYGRKDVVPTLNDLFKDIVSPREVHAYFTKNRKKLLKEGENEQIGLARSNYELKVERITKKYSEKLNELYDSKKLTLGILPPNLGGVGFNFEHFPSIGAKKGKLELVALSNYHCKRCRLYDKQIKKLFKKYKKELKYTHIGHGFIPNSVSMDTLLAGHCVLIGKKEKFWQLHKSLYLNNEISDLKENNRKGFKKILEAEFKQLDLPKKGIFDCMSNDDNMKILSKSILFFKDMGIRDLPVFFLNGRRLNLHDSKDLERSFERMLSSLKLNKLY